MKNWIYKKFFKSSFHTVYFILGDIIGLLGYILLSDYINENQFLSNSELITDLLQFPSFILSHFLFFYFSSLNQENKQITNKSIVLGVFTPMIFSVFYHI
ncbi:hypothetical protein EHR01_10535 [Leptospira mtsangambouensis]|uniref:Uncharacterized protein n=1 Tax=Leptospira mtsangambouensis TaxID=2484912 RepID=A0ABY2NZZ6_9LEPT|nr:hypothetical protein [Leptospira mtsangambouensis]TGM74389.1 hypothetical protein EHR01_10535 [Leptospira mtsangambouensis]